MYIMFLKKLNCFNWFEDLFFLKIYMMVIVILIRSVVVKIIIIVIMVGVFL